MTTGTPGANKHIKDENEFFSDLKGGDLPKVVFVKPTDNEHPNNMSGLLYEDNTRLTWSRAFRTAHTGRVPSSS
jgi:hypothetical protein